MHYEQQVLVPASQRPEAKALGFYNSAKRVVGFTYRQKLRPPYDINFHPSI